MFLSKVINIVFFDSTDLANPNLQNFYQNQQNKYRNHTIFYKNRKTQLPHSDYDLIKCFVLFRKTVLKVLKNGNFIQGY